MFGFEKLRPKQAVEKKEMTPQEEYEVIFPKFVEICRKHELSGDPDLSIPEDEILAELNEEEKAIWNRVKELRNMNAGELPRSENPE